MGRGSVNPFLRPPLASLARLATFTLGQISSARGLLMQEIYPPFLRAKVAAIPTSVEGGDLRLGGLP